MSHSFSSNWMGLDFTFIVGCIENPGGATGISPGLRRFNLAKSLGCSWKKLQFFNYFFLILFFLHANASFARSPLWPQTPYCITYFWSDDIVPHQNTHDMVIVRKISEHQRPSKDYAPMSLLSGSNWLTPSNVWIKSFHSSGILHCNIPPWQSAQSPLGVIRGSASTRYFQSCTLQLHHVAPAAALSPIKGELRVEEPAQHWSTAFKTGHQV